MNNYLKAEFETITPETAADLLTRNIQNRPLNQKRVRQYMNDMLAGRWEENGEAIKITKDGRLADGQHRLKAIIQASRAARILVVRGLDNAAIPTLDTGKTRSAGDVISLSGMFSKNEGAAVAMAARLLIRYEAGTVGASTWLTGDAGGHNRMTSTNAIVHAYAKAHLQEFTDNLAWLKKSMNTACMLSAGERLFFFTVFNRLDPEAAKTFMLQVFKGVGLPEKGTTLFLNEMLRFIKSKKSRQPASQTRHTIIKCWNIVRGGRDVKHRSSIYASAKDGIFAK